MLYAINKFRINLWKLYKFKINNNDLGDDEKVMKNTIKKGLTKQFIYKAS